MVAMVAVLPPHHHLGHSPLLLLLLATVGVGGPSFPTIFQSDVKSSPIETGYSPTILVCEIVAIQFQIHT